MAMELKIMSPGPEGFVKEIVWNADEISAEIAEKVGYYKNLVYTEAQVTDAKKDRASLNRFIDALKAKDREIKGQCLAPYEVFHERMLQIISQVEEPAALIDRQIKAFEEEQKKKKRKDIEDLFSGKGFQPWVEPEMIWNPKWLNKTYSMKQIDEDMNREMYRIGNDIFLINQQAGGVQAGLAEYKKGLNVVDAVNAAQAFIKAKEAENAVIEEAVPEKDESAVTASYYSPESEDRGPAPERKEIFFKVFVSREELSKLNAFLKENGYTFMQVRNRN